MDLAGTGGGTVLMGGVQLPRDAAPGTLGTLYEAQGWVHAPPPCQLWLPLALLVLFLI